MRDLQLLGFNRKLNERVTEKQEDSMGMTRNSSGKTPKVEWTAKTEGEAAIKTL